MKILFICPSFNIGGFSSYTLNLGREFSKRGICVDVLVEEPIGDLEAPFRQVFPHMSVACRGVETRAGYVRRLARIVNELAPDVAINSGVAFMQAAWPLLKPEIRRVVVIHSIAEREVQVACANRKYVDSLVAVSENVRAVAAPLAGAVRLETIPVGVRLPSNSPLSRLPPPPLRLIWVGRLTEGSKNLTGLCAIIDELRCSGVKFALRVIGDGPDRRMIDRRAANADWAEAVIFEGAVLPERVSELLSEAHVFLLPSTFEGTPHALLEAMAVGCVPVASRIPGSTDRIIADGITGRLCQSADTAAFISAITELAESSQVLDRMRIAAMDKIREYYTIEIVAREYLELFADLREIGEARPTRQTTPTFPIPLIPSCHALARHLRRRCGDLYRRITKKYAC